MNRALHKLTDEERAEMIAQYKADFEVREMLRGGWPDMHQEPDWLEGEARPGTMVGIVLIITGIVLLLLGAWIAWGAWE